MINLFFQFVRKTQMHWKEIFLIWKENKGYRNLECPQAPKEHLASSVKAYVNLLSGTPLSDQHPGCLFWSLLVSFCTEDRFCLDSPPMLHCQVSGNKYRGHTWKALCKCPPRKQPHCSDFPCVLANSRYSGTKMPDKCIQTPPPVLLEQHRHSYEYFKVTDVISKYHERFPSHIYVMHLIHICPLRSLFEHLAFCCEPPHGWMGATLKPGSNAWYSLITYFASNRNKIECKKIWQWLIFVYSDNSF